jgi:hypothetical protein
MRYIANEYFGGHISKREYEEVLFERNLDPSLSEAEKRKQIWEFLHRRDEDTINAMDNKRIDDEERRLAFVESLLDAIKTDTEPLYKKGRDILRALKTNNAERLLIALCGWNANSLAKRARIIPDDALEFYGYDEEARLIVRWSNGKQSTSKCTINPVSFYVSEFRATAFNKYAETAEITEVVVEVQPEYTKEKNYFRCIAKEDRDRAGDKLSYWYSLNPNDEDDEEIEIDIDTLEIKNA